MTEEPKSNRVGTHHRIQGSLHFEAPYFTDLVRGNEFQYARLPRDIAAHALWHYFLVGSYAWARVLKNETYEGERSAAWNPRAIFEGIAMQHGVVPKDMGRYWDVVKQQRYALGLTSNADLPERFCFKE